MELYGMKSFPDSKTPVLERPISHSPWVTNTLMDRWRMGPRGFASAPVVKRYGERISSWLERNSRYAVFADHFVVFKKPLKPASTKR